LTPRSLIHRALDAIPDGEYDLAVAALEEADAILQRRESGWVTVHDLPTVADMSVFDEDDAS
jgi:hypothetical protein